MNDLVPATATEFDVRNAESYTGLTEMQNLYVYFRQLGFTPTQAARRAKYDDPISSGRDNERNAYIRQLITEIPADRRPIIEIDRQKVLEGMLEALAVAREMSDPKTMLNVWSEITKVCGVGAPEVKRIEIEGKVQQHHIAKASDRELLAIIGRKRELQTLEGDFERVEDAR
jgi:hypothetical protein